MCTTQNENMNHVTETACALFRSGCLKFGTFKIKSGVLSPYYIDLTWLLSSPRDLSYIAHIVANKIKKIRLYEPIDKLASIELKGALILPSITSTLNIPSVVVRKAEKKYGLTGRIVGGTVRKGENLLFFDDVISEGTSKLEGINPLEDLGAHVNHIMVIVDREQGGKENMNKLGYNLHALTTISGLIKALLQSSCISKEVSETILSYIKDKG